MSAAGERARDLGLGHRTHPLLGQTVLDTASGRTGVLRAVCPEPASATSWRDPVPRPGSGPPVAWLAPPGGGTEWTTRAEAVTVAADPDQSAPDQSTERNGEETKRGRPSAQGPPPRSGTFRRR